MSHPEYISPLLWSTFPLKAMLNIGELEILVLANCTIFSHKMNADQLKRTCLILVAKER